MSIEMLQPKTVTSVVTMDESLKVATEAERWRRFGQFVRGYRQDRAQLSQTDAAKRAGMTRQQWNRIEQGSSGSKRSSIIKIAEALAADAVVFLNQAGFQESESLEFINSGDDVEARRLMRYFNDLPRECQLDVMALTEALWQRRRAEGRAEKALRRSAGKHRPQTVKPGVERKPPKRKVG